MLPAKIDTPRLLSSTVPRPRLTQVIMASPARCVVVCGPAGYGKTTVLRQLVDDWDGPAGWITADRSDEDARSFARALVGALGHVVALDDAREQLAAPTPVTTTALPALARAIAEAPTPFVLVVDDAHELVGSDTLALVSHLIDAIPDGSRIVLGGRSVPSVRLPRRRLSEPVLELGPEDLVFTLEEAAEALRAGRGPELAPSTVAELHHRTEGWPAGLQLALLALESRPDPDRALHSLIEGGGNLADYIEQELLAAAAPDDRRFLLETSVLTRLEGPLCDAVTGSTGSGARLERLVAGGNLFVVPLATSATYRYHHLFGELLLAELRRTAPDLEPILHRRAAEWLVDDGDGHGAVRHALASDDLGFAADVVYRLLFPAIARSSPSSLEQWLSWFPPEELRRRAPLLIAQAWAAASRGGTAEVAELLDRLDDAPDEGPLPDGTVSVEVAAAALRVVAGRDGVKAMARWAEVVIDAGPAGSPWWGMAHMLRAVALHLSGAEGDPVELYDAAERATRGDGAVHAITLAHCGLARLQRDDADGYPLVDRARRELLDAGADEQPLAVMVFTVLAYADAKRGRAAASTEAAARADRQIDVVGDAVPRGVAHHRLVLADAALLRRDLPAAARELALAQEALVHEPDAVVLHEWADRVAQRTSARRRADGETAWSQLSPAELRVLEQLRTHRSLEEIAAHLFVSRNTVKSHTIAIYRKLGASGRSAAVERAEQLGLFGP